MLLVPLATSSRRRCASCRSPSSPTCEAANAADALGSVGSGVPRGFGPYPSRVSNLPSRPRPWRAAWWKEPVRDAGHGAGRPPRWAVLVLLAWGLANIATLWWLLPSLGVRWFYDYWRVGGFLPLLAALGLAAWWLDRTWPPNRD